MRLDFKNTPVVQDLLCLLMQERGFTVQEAITWAINRTTYRCILQTGEYAKQTIAFLESSSERAFKQLQDPIVEFDPSSHVKLLLNIIEDETKSSTEAVIGYFLVFAVEDMTCRVLSQM